MSSRMNFTSASSQLGEKTLAVELGREENGEPVPVGAQPFGVGHGAFVGVVGDYRQPMLGEELGNRRKQARKIRRGDA